MFLDLIVHSDILAENTVQECSDASSTAPEASTLNSMDDFEVAPKAVLKKPKFWAVGGGKGGVGKSLISANFSLSLARKGRRVLGIDLDLGGSNLHTCLGIDPPKVGIGDWATGRLSLPEIAVPTLQRGLTIISGSPDPLHVIPLIENRVQELIRALGELDYDDVVMDLGAGTHTSTIDFFNSADQGLLSILPEPTSVENAYRFIRSVFYRRLKSVDVSDGVKEVIDAAMDSKNILGLRTPADLLAVIERLDRDAFDLIHQNIRGFSPSIIINQVRSQVDIDVGRAICSVCRRYFGIEIKYAGYLEYENSVWKAVRAKRAFIEEFPHTLLASRFDTLARTLLGEEKGIFP